jgi:hypothetical protein
VDCAGCRRNISGWVPAGLKISNNINGILVPKIPPKCKRVWAGYPCQYGGARCEAQRSIDVRNWHRRNLLTPPGRAFAWRWARNGESASAISVLSGVRASSCATGSRSVDRTLLLPAAAIGHGPFGCPQSAMWAALPQRRSLGLSDVPRSALPIRTRTQAGCGNGCRRKCKSWSSGAAACSLFWPPVSPANPILLRGNNGEGEGRIGIFGFSAQRAMRC